jgi:RNA polymerase sigma-70 factor (ECF subfamily)
MHEDGPGAALLQQEIWTIGAHAERDDAASAARGDAPAFERLYRMHCARIHSLARRMAGEERAPDLTQEIFLRAWERLGTFRGDAAFGTWLHRLAINWILSRRASWSTERSRVTGGEAELARQSARPSRPEARIDFEAAIARLPEGARLIFVLHDVEGYKHEEIAAGLGIHSGTSKAQLHRARMLLRRHLER